MKRIMRETTPAPMATRPQDKPGKILLSLSFENKLGERESVRQSPRVAVVHDWLDTYVGSERALAGILSLWPRADLFTLVDFLPLADRGFLEGHRITTSFLQHLPLARRHFRKYVPLMPRAIESFDLAGYDMVISSAHAFAKGVRTRPGQYHLCYCYTPMRYAWAMQGDYLRAFGLGGGPAGWLARRELAKLREWDRAAALRVTDIVAISRHVAGRIRDAYGREAPVIYPPVDVEAFTPREAKEAYYVVVSRLVPYKRVDAVVEAFHRMPGRDLVVIGEGPQRAMLEQGKPANVRLLGYAPHEVVVDYLRRARAFVFAGEEDFGIAPVEALASGTPVIALGRGGLLETVVEGESGMFFPEPTPEAIVNAVERFEAHSPAISARACRERAMVFSAARFRRELGEFADNAWLRYQRERVN